MSAKSDNDRGQRVVKHEQYSSSTYILSGTRFLGNIIIGLNIGSLICNITNS